MTDTYRSDEWDDEELVPLGELRPSREVFGPLARPHQGRGKGRPQRPAAPRALPSGRRNEGRDGRTAEPRRPQGERRGAPVEGRSTTGPRRPVDPRQAERREQELRRRGGQTTPNDAPLVKPNGWRGALSRVVGSSDRRTEELRAMLRSPLTDGTVAVFSRKGGVGKTTISAYLGLTLATERGGRIVALDGDAEAGSLGWLLAPRAPSTLAALASAHPIPDDYAGLRRYTTKTAEGLEVIVGDPAEMGPISTSGLEVVAQQLSRHYDISIFDTGAGVTRATGRALVGSARVLLLVMGPSVDSVRAAERTLAWLDERPEGLGEDVKVIAVINGISANIKASHIDKIENHFADRCDAVVRIPWDAHLGAGSSTVALDRLNKHTRKAFLELAATTVNTLADRPQRRPSKAGQRRG